MTMPNMVQPRETELDAWRQLLERLAPTIGAANLWDILADAVGKGDLTQEESDILLGEYVLDAVGIPREQQQNIRQFTSKADLADRLTSSGLDRAIAESVYNVLSNVSPENLALRDATGRVATEQEKLRQHREKQAQQAQISREERATDLTKALAYTQNNPLVSQQDLSGIRGFLNQNSEDFLSGKSNAVIDALSTLNQQVESRSRREGQTAEALLAGFNVPGSNPLRQTEQIPQIPNAGDIAKSYLEGTGLGRGTKLQSFIASEIPGIYQETAPERSAWWKRMNPIETPELSFEEAQSRYGAEAAHWASVAESAPSSEVAGGTAYGPGGLKALAETAYQNAQAKLAGLRPEDFQRSVLKTPSPEEDPFTAALRRKNFWASYNRMPGTGIVPRLTPSIRMR